MSRNLTIVGIVAAVLLALAILGGLVWANMSFARFHIGGKDFLVPWLDARTYLQYGNNPYELPATQRAQVLFYGRLAKAGEDPLLLDVPFPVEILYLPLTVFADYALARGVWSTLLEVALVATGFLSLGLTGWRPGRFLLPVWLLFSIFWTGGLFSLLTGGSMALVALAIAGVLAALKTGRDELAGALLVVPFFKTDIGGIFVLFIFWWIIVERRGRVFGGFLMTLVILVLASIVLLPSWFVPFLRGVISHYLYTPTLTPGRILESWWPAVGGKLAWGLTGGLLLALIAEWRAVRGKDFRHFLWTASLTLTATPLLGIPVSPLDYAFLLIPLALVLTILAERWTKSGQWPVRVVPLLLVFIVGWLYTSSRVPAGTMAAGMALGLPVVLLVCLYWMRWWAIRPRPLGEIIRKEKAMR